MPTARDRGQADLDGSRRQSEARVGADVQNINRWPEELTYCEVVESAHRITYVADRRAVLTNAADPEVISHIIASWTVPAELPAGVHRLWERACGQFHSGPVAYENFTDAVRTAFEAVDASLRWQIADRSTVPQRLTFGRLVQCANRLGVLTAQQLEWLTEYAVHFRNRLTHSDGRAPIVLSPAIAADMMQGIARFLEEFVGDAIPEEVSEPD